MLRWLYSELSTLLVGVPAHQPVAHGGCPRCALRTCTKPVASFQRSHGPNLSEANYSNAVQTIWGAEQSQDELKFDMYWEEEVTGTHSRIRGRHQARRFCERKSCDTTSRRTHFCKLDTK